MIKIFAGLYPTPMTIYLLLIMQIIKAINAHTIRAGTVVHDVCAKLYLKFLGNVS